MKGRCTTFCILVFILLIGTTPVAIVAADDHRPKVMLETPKGTVVIELNPEAAPETTDNFIRYVESGFYDGTIFHRVIKGFMIQGGGFTADMRQKPTRAPVVNEADNGLKNSIGTIAMARTRDPHSATAQFFINVADNTFLDHTAKNDAGWGYCVFGRVVAGMDVIRAIEAVPTTTRAGHRDVPAQTVLIQRVVMADDK